MTSAHRVLGRAVVRLGFAVIFVGAALTETWPADMSNASGCTSPYKKRRLLRAGCTPSCNRTDDGWNNGMRVASVRIFANRTFVKPRSTAPTWSAPTWKGPCYGRPISLKAY
jgi:hypothetical protein